MTPIDNADYDRGRAAYAGGMTLYALFEKIAPAEKGGAAEERQALSFALGFADALLADLRTPRAVVTPGVPR